MRVYLLTNIQNGRRYVGSTIESLANRRAKHLYKARACPDDNRPLFVDMRAFPREAFQIALLAECDSLEDMHRREARYIKELGTMLSDGGYNVASDGNHGIGDTFTDEHRRALSARRQAWWSNPQSRRKYPSFRELLNARRAEVLALREGGKPYNEIGRILGCTGSAVFYAVKRWRECPTPHLE